MGPSDFLETLIGYQPPPPPPDPYAGLPPVGPGMYQSAPALPPPAGPVYQAPATYAPPLPRIVPKG